MSREVISERTEGYEELRVWREGGKEGQREGGGRETGEITKSESLALPP